MKEKETHLVDYFLVLRRRRWVMFSTFLLVVISAAIGAYRKPEPIPQYQAITTLVVKPDRPALVNISGAQPFYQQYFDEGVDQRTQLQILTSRVIIERLVDALGLLKPDSSTAIEEAVIEQIRHAISVEHIPGTYLVKIIAYDHSPERVIQLANTMAEVYIEYNLQVKLSSARKTLVWLNEQIVDLRSKVQDAYAALSKYQNQNQVLSLEISPEAQAQKLAELNYAHDQAKQERIEAETRLTELRKWQQQNGGFGAEIIASIEDPVLEKLRTELMEAEIERTNLSQSYKEKHPKIKEVEVKIQMLHQNLGKALETVFKKLETNLSIAQAKEETLAAALEKFKRDAIEMNTKRLEYSKLKGEVSSTEELYNLLFQQLKETSITSDLERNNIHVLEPARTARNITQPLQREQIIGFGVIIGLLLGVGLVFLVEYFDKTIKNPEDVERYLGLSVLGTIPKIDKDYGKAYGRASSLSSKKKQYVLEAGK
jgi:succinoglycan biosynthesis transport protein ExoP